MTQKITSRAGRIRRLQVFGLLGGAALIIVGAEVSQAAITPSNVDPWQHIVDCARALFDDPAEHAKYCEPGPAPVDFKGSFMWAPVNPPPSPPPSSSSSIQPPS